MPHLKEHADPTAGPEPHSLAVRRAILPELLFAPDLAVALGGIPETVATAAVLAGDCGPYVRIAGRLAVRREAFLSALEDREHDPMQGSNGGAR